MKASKAFGDIPGVRSVTAYGTSLHLNAMNIEDLKKEVEKTARREGIEIISMNSIEASLEDVFASLEGVVSEKH